MSTVLQVAVLIGVAYVAIIGGIGAVLSRSRGGTLNGGFWRSGFIPLPLGWIWVLIATRKSRRRTQDDLVLDGPSNADWTSTVSRPRFPTTPNDVPPTRAPIRPLPPAPTAGPHDY